MENREHSSPGYGPRPAGSVQTGRPLSRSRAAVLETLQGQPEPVTLAALVAVTQLHPNTVREHLDALVRRQLVRRERSRPSGRGRPAWRYAAVAPDDSGRMEYAGLASALAATIHRTSDNPREDAIAAGTHWGRELARGIGRPPESTDTAARDQVVALLDEMGFAPEADDTTSAVRLTRCPLLEAAHRHPDVVCGVHLGVVRGALEEYGADGAHTDLHPFSEPGACRLDLLTGAPRGAQ